MKGGKVKDIPRFSVSLLRDRLDLPSPTLIFKDPSPMISVSGHLSFMYLCAGGRAKIGYLNPGPWYLLRLNT